MSTWLPSFRSVRKITIYQFGQPRRRVEGPVGRVKNQIEPVRRVKKTDRIYLEVGTSKGVEKQHGFSAPLM